MIARGSELRLELIAEPDATTAPTLEEVCDVTDELLERLVEQAYRPWTETSPGFRIEDLQHPGG